MLLRNAGTLSVCVKNCSTSCDAKPATMAATEAACICVSSFSAASLEEARRFKKSHARCKKHAFRGRAASFAFSDSMACVTHSPNDETLCFCIDADTDQKKPPFSAATPTYSAAREVRDAKGFHSVSASKAASGAAMHTSMASEAAASKSCCRVQIASIFTFGLSAEHAGKSAALRQTGVADSSQASRVGSSVDCAKRAASFWASNGVSSYSSSRLTPESNKFLAISCAKTLLPAIRIVASLSLCSRHQQKTL